MAESASGQVHERHATWARQTFLETDENAAPRRPPQSRRRDHRLGADVDRLRIRNDKDVVWDDASEDMLRSLLVQFLRPGQFLIVDRGMERAEEGFAQVIVADDRSLVVEYRNGADAEQWAALAPDVTTAQEVLAG